MVMEDRKLICVLSVLLFTSHTCFLIAIRSQLLPVIDDDNGGRPGLIQTYIVHVREPEGVVFHQAEYRESWHRSFLPNRTLDSGEQRLVYSYRNAISGFAARLTSEEAEAMKKMNGFLFARPEKEIVGQTTYTYSFLGLDQNNGLWYNVSYGEGMIIGMIDSGVTPTHPSFRGDGISPPPDKWKGRCDLSPPFVCNNKLIGATAFLGQGASPVDEHGHGTHTASTAAGNIVYNAEVLGQAKGDAAGMARGAHLATYRVLDDNRGDESSILAGIDQAIGDEVDVLSMSLGAPRGEAMHVSSIAISSFSAIVRGIVPICAAGNDGPFPGNVTNDAPWCLTVGASTVDRRITATVVLGNGMEIYGESAYQPSFNSTVRWPMVFPGFNVGDDTANCIATVWWPIVLPGFNAGDDAENCIAGTLPSSVQGTIVMCATRGLSDSNIVKGQNVKAAGGVAMVLMNRDGPGFTTFADPHVLPVSHVSFADAEKIVNYLLTTASPVATINFKGTLFGARPTPAVASFSSRGPSSYNGGIIKPDIVAPGVNILAAWPTEVGPNPSGTTTSTFNFQSGTSMATPHVSGIVAMLKKNHPQWSPAAIKSAIMTTASVLDNQGNRIIDQHGGGTANFFAMGAGHIDPNKANDPGLVYDLQPIDYIPYLCGLYPKDNNLVEVIVRQKVDCSNQIGAEQLNYPSIAVTLPPNTWIIIQRTVTNVNDGASYYTPDIVAPNGVSVEVVSGGDPKSSPLEAPRIPQYLGFSSQYEKRSFQIKITTGNTLSLRGQISEGFLSWVSATTPHVVRSPISVTFA